MVKVRDMNGLVYQHPSQWISVGHGSRDRTVLCTPESGVICFKIDRSVIVLEYISVLTEHARVSVGVKFQCGLIIWDV